LIVPYVSDAIGAYEHFICFLSKYQDQLWSVCFSLCYKRLYKVNRKTKL